MEEALTAWLLGRAGLTALIADRLFWERREQGSAVPAVVLHKIGGAPDYHMKGRSGLVDSRVQVNCLGGTKAEALAVKRQVQAAFDQPVAAPFRGFFIEADWGDFEPADGPPAAGAPSDLFMSSLDVRVWSNEATD